METLVSNKPERNILKISEKITEDWIVKTVTVFIKKGEIISTKEISFLENFLGTKKYNIGSLEEGEEFLVCIIFCDVIFPEIDIHQREEGGKHC